ncbi:MAG TPA: isochorismatase family cysteine hydrolase [Gaiellaceae bacterium]|jgi:nicotinamidase-related amidase|nr:isochorismatase family cysteine hydrolase [Gaiellaceae bacterium]
MERGDAILVIDLLNDFVHEDGDALLSSLRERAPNIGHVLEVARDTGVPVIYVNDERGAWTSDAVRLVRIALEGKAGDLVEPLLPQAGDPVLLKHRYSAFDHTALDILLESQDVRRVLLVGAATEGCVVQTAIDARERGLKASIVVDACATTSPELEAIALAYAEKVGGIHLEHVTQEPSISGSPNQGRVAKSGRAGTRR